MQPDLPAWIDPIAAARASKEFTGRIALTELGRLAPLLYQQEGNLAVRLAFGIAEGGVPCVSGEAKGCLVLVCQRCLEPLTLDLVVTLRLGFVPDMEAGERLSQGYEPVIVEPGGRVRIADLVEDELLLSLPTVPLHGETQRCRPPGGKDNQDGEARQHPFAVLAALKND